MSARPLKLDVIGLPFGDCAIRPPTRSLDAMTRPAAPVYFKKSLRVGLISAPKPQPRRSRRSSKDREERAGFSSRSSRGLRALRGLLFTPPAIPTSYKSLPL